VSVPQSFNHVAVLTLDSHKTYDFYTRILGMKLLSAVRENSVPSTGEKVSFLHTFYGMEDGSCLAFFELDGLQLPKVDDGVPRWVRHFAMNVATNEELLSWKERIEANGVEVRGVVDHEGIWQSIYFFDPNGLRLELTWQRRELDEYDGRRGLELLEQWTREHEQLAAPGAT
jgi:glyoxylase I family protein